MLHEYYTLTLLFYSTLSLFLLYLQGLMEHVNETLRTTLNTVVSRLHQDDLCSHRERAPAPATSRCPLPLSLFTLPPFLLLLPSFLRPRSSHFHSPACPTILRTIAFTPAARKHRFNSPPPSSRGALSAGHLSQMPPRSPSAGSGRVAQIHEAAHLVKETERALQQVLAEHVLMNGRSKMLCSR